MRFWGPRRGDDAVAASVVFRDLDPPPAMQSPEQAVKHDRKQGRDSAGHPLRTAPWSPEEQQELGVGEGAVQVGGERSAGMPGRGRGLGVGAWGADRWA